MQLSQIPSKIAAIFAASGNKNTIPLTTAGITTPNQASFDVGFPAITQTPISSGGLPPYGADFNGILNAITAVNNWSSAGGLFPYDSTFATTVGGYPKGAIVLKALGLGVWQSVVDNNLTSPDTGGAGWIDPTTLSGAVAGDSRNLTMFISTASTSGTLTADEIVVETALGGIPFKLSNYSQVINLSTTGAGGMDTGTAPASGFVALYAIYNPTTKVASILATNAATNQPTIYGGANMPTGYTFSALVAILPTTAGRQFGAANLIGRTVAVQPILVLSTSTQQSVLTVLALSTVPINAKTISGTVQIGSTSVANQSAYISSTSNSIGSVQTFVGGAYEVVSQYSNLQLITPQTMYYSAVTSLGTMTVAITVNQYTF